MRDIDRIDPIIEELRKYWKTNQDLRFGQVYCIIGDKVSETMDNLFFDEDDKWLEMFERLNKGKDEK